MTGQTILVIEDSLFNRKLLEAVLKPQGYDLLEAQDGETGLKMALQYLPDLILMDLHLPGINGLQATQKLQANAQTKNIPVVALTANVLEEELVRARAAGCVGHILKPIDTRAFPEQIANFLAQAKRSA